MSPTSKSIPFIVLAIVGLTLVAETYYEIEIDVEAFVPVLTAMGVGGAAIKIVQDASAAKKAIPENVKDLVKDEIGRVVPKRDALS